MLSGNRLFGFLVGATLAGSGTYYYVVQDYKASNELLQDDIYVRCRHQCNPQPLYNFPRSSFSNGSSMHSFLFESYLAPASHIKQAQTRSTIADLHWRTNTGPAGSHATNEQLPDHTRRED